MISNMPRVAELLSGSFLTSTYQADRADDVVGACVAPLHNLSTLRAVT